MQILILIVIIVIYYYFSDFMKHLPKIPINEHCCGLYQRHNIPDFLSYGGTTDVIHRVGPSVLNAQWRDHQMI